MSSVVLILDISCVFLIVLYLLQKYGDLKHHNVFVTIATLISWYFSFLIIFLLPIDVSLTIYRQCINDNKNNTANITNTCKVPWSYVPDSVFPILWRIIYWTSQVLTWIILPFMQSFSQSGEFTLRGKIKGALISNAIYYGTYLAILGVLLIYVAIKHDIRDIDGQKLKVIGITASNTWGLFLLVILLGFGLIDVPRSIWYKSMYKLSLNQYYFKLAKLHNEKCETEENLEDILKEIKTIAEQIKYNNTFRDYVDQILKKCPENFKNTIKRNVEDYHDYNSENEDNNDLPSEKYFVRLHTKLIKCLQTTKRINSQWQLLVEKTIFLENIVLSEDSKNHTLYTTMELPSFKKVSLFFNKNLSNPTLVWIYYCFLKRWLLRLLSILLMVLTFMVIWSEMTFFNRRPILTFFALLLDAFHKSYNYVTIEISCCIIIAYLCFCAYYTIFKIRIFNYYYLAPNHMTNENSLLFSGTFICRLTSPLCYNFLGLVHLDSHITKDTRVTETAFTSIMGHMDVISFISDGFNIYFPMLIFVLCLATFFNLGGRILHFFGFQQFIGDTDVTLEFVEDGKNIIQREKRVLQRNVDQHKRREMIQKWKLQRKNSKSQFVTAENEDEEYYNDSYTNDNALLIDNKSNSIKFKNKQNSDLDNIDNQNISNNNLKLMKSIFDDI